jgi:hypothetical protein
MTTHLIEQLQEILHIKPLQKIDPNTQDVIAAAVDTSNASKLHQAVIPAVLTGLYKLTRTLGGAEQVLRGNLSTSWGALLFGENKDLIISRITTYATASPVTVSGEVDLVANEAANLVKNNAGGAKTATAENIITYMKAERNNILHYLPAALQLGALLEDDTLDDHTHKMDGPVSGLMHRIEKAFSGAPPAEDQNTSS